MSDIVWLASYPKSGNTWFRMLVANLWAQDETPVDINDLPERGGIASSREWFDQATMLDSGLLTYDEADCLRPRVYESEASRGAGNNVQVPEPRFVKVHDAYTTTLKSEPLLGGSRAAQGAVVLVRDPRDIAPSLAHHLQISIDEAIAFMGCHEAAFSVTTRTQSNQLRQKLLTWSAHVTSWLDQQTVPIHVVRYEDLQGDTVEVLRAALCFAGRSVTQGLAERAVRLADFRNLQAQERDRGFREWWVRKADTLFFRHGRAGAWRHTLRPAQVARLEADHGATMQRLGYQLTTAGEN